MKKSVLLILSIWMSFAFAPRTFADEAALLRASPLHLFPDPKSDSIVTLNAGAKLTTVQKSNEWCLVESQQIGNKFKGWLACANLAGSSTDEKSAPAVVSPPEVSPVPYYSHPTRFSVAVNPVTILFPWIEIQLGFELTPQFRLNITPQFMTWAYGSDPFDGGVFGGTISGSFFMDPWKGWYVEPGVVYLRGTKGSGYALGGQLIGGYEHEWKSGFFMNLGLGAGVAHFDDGDDDDDFLDFTGTYPYPTGNLHIGVKF